VGKSSLLNLLSGFDRAIVSPVAGTTRDTIEEVLHVHGLPFVLVDTAGGRTEATFDRFGLIKLPTDAKAATEIWESACDATIDGEQAAGQWETHWPREYLNHLVASRQR